MASELERNPKMQRHLSLATAGRYRTLLRIFIVLCIYYFYKLRRIDMPHRPKRLFEMASEFCREAAILIFVFGNLDTGRRGRTGELARVNFGRPAVVWQVAEIMALTVLFGGGGILSESWSAR
jgi:hypothetical protein